MDAHPLRRSTGSFYFATQHSSRCHSKEQVQRNNKRQKNKAGLICTLHPKRISSLGKIITRPCTPQKTKTLSIEVQTIDRKPLMENKGIQVQDFEEIVVQKPLCQTTNSAKQNKYKSKETLLQISDPNFLNYQFQKYARTVRKKFDPKEERVSKTAKKEQSINKEQYVGCEIKLFKENSILKKEVDKNVRKIVQQSKQRCRSFREDHIQKLSAEYEKNLAKYESNKEAIMDLLKSNRLR